jgi:hypothetical protein
VLNTAMSASVLVTSPVSSEASRPLAQVTECNVCMERDRNAVFLPCSHVVCCNECASKIKAQRGRCPVCRTAIAQVFPLFFA